MGYTDNNDGISHKNKEMTEASLEKRRAALGEKLSQRNTVAEKEESPAMLKKAENYNKSSLAAGVRLSTDFLSAILVGGALGLAIDKLAGSAPWGLLLFLLLGFAAGIVNILRVMGRTVSYGAVHKKRQSTDSKQ